MITKIQHLSSLRRLIFLDLYDNMIMEISGLQTLVSLRVLMLGKNRLRILCLCFIHFIAFMCLLTVYYINYSYIYLLLFVCPRHSYYGNFVIVVSSSVVMDE